MDSENLPGWFSTCTSYCENHAAAEKQTQQNSDSPKDISFGMAPSLLLNQ